MPCWWASSHISFLHGRRACTEGWYCPHRLWIPPSQANRKMPTQYPQGKLMEAILCLKHLRYFQSVLGWQPKLTERETYRIACGLSLCIITTEKWAICINFKTSNVNKENQLCSEKEQSLRSSVHCRNKQRVLWGAGNHTKNLKARTKMCFEGNGKKLEMN